jgi:MHS family proline/betaine transporter-like MFS transporter
MLASAPPEVASGSRSNGRLVAAGLIGNVLEWYDFSIYGYFAPLIGQHFFPSSNPATSLIAAFGVFSAGFLTRPFGALVFGWIGDRYGRERALMASILAMALPTALTGLMPDYSSIGITASVLMVAARLVQGLSAGGEYTTSIVFLAERSRGGRRGLVASFGLFGSIAGGMLGSAAGAMLGWAMTPAALDRWGWRLPFLFGVVLAGVGAFIRGQLRALPASERPTFRLRDITRDHWRAMLHVGGFEIFEAVGFYMVFIYLATYAPRFGGLPQAAAFAISTLSLAFALFIIPAAAALSDRFGRKPILLMAAGCAILFAWSLFELVSSGRFLVTLAGQLGLAAIVSLYEGATPAAAAESFPRAVRCTGVALAFNITMTIFGGTSPAVATYLIELAGTSMAPAAYFIAAAAVSAAFVLTGPETALEDLRE